MSIRILKIGRENTDIIIEDSSVSRSHAELAVLADGRYYLTDCASTSGTYVYRDSEWHVVKQDFVSGDELVCFGQYQTSLSCLQDTKSYRPVRDGNGYVVNDD